jgi:hypothetical protein
MINLEQPDVINKEREATGRGTGDPSPRRNILAVWAMVIGMITLMNITMLAAIMQVAGSIPDRSLLHILSRYLKRKREPPEALLHPWEATSRLGRMRKRILGGCVAMAVLGAALSVWALSIGWGVVAMLAITCWLAAGNLLFDSIAPASWQRRAMRMDMNMDEEEKGGSSPPKVGGS